MTAIPLPEGYHSVNPYVVVKGGAAFIDFMVATMDGAVHERMVAPDGTIGHAEVRIGDSIVMLTDGEPELRPSPCSLYVFVDDVDAVYRKAIRAGATSVKEPVDEFYGDRTAGVVDPCGNTWWIATHLEDVAPEELARRGAARDAARAAGGADAG
jgi:PhnB protein